MLAIEALIREWHAHMQEARYADVGVEDMYMSDDFTNYTGNNTHKALSFADATAEVTTRAEAGRKQTESCLVQ